MCLFEALTARRPFSGASAAELLSSILRDTPPRLSELVDRLPPTLDRLVGRCLDKTPASRPATAAEVARVLAETRAVLASSGSTPIATETLPGTGSYRTPLVGRDAQAAQLRDAADRAATSHGGLITLAGEPGVGKTRLAMTVAGWATAGSFTTLVGQCYEGEGARPFNPWVEMLDALARTVPKTTLREWLGEGAPEVAKLHPGLRRQFPDLPPPLEMPPDAERAYLFDCFGQFIERASRQQPLLLVLEDLHWADESSLLLLQQLAPQLGRLPVLVVATYRNVELDTARPLASTLRHLVRARLVERIALGRLPAANVAEMLEALSGRRPPAALVGAIHAETEGNPFFVEEVYQHLDEEGRLFDQAGEWRTDLTMEELDVPEGVRLVVGRRLERLDQEGRRVLTVAAGLGRRFSYSLLETAAGGAPDAVLEQVEAAERLQLIEAESGSGSREPRYRFAHELIRQTLLQALSMPRRQRLHLQVADAIEETYRVEVEDHAPALAHHLYEAGAAADDARTIRFLTLAGDRALATGAFDEALTSYERALSLQVVGDAAAHASLVSKRAAARQSLGDWEDAIADWRVALEAYESLGDLDAIVATTLQTVFLLNWKERPADTVAIARHSLDVAAGGRGTDHARLLAEHGWSLSLLGETEAGAAQLAEALAMLDGCDDPHARGEVLIRLSYHHLLSSQRRLEAETALEAADLLRPQGDLWNLVDALGVYLWAAVQCGELDAVTRFEDEATELAVRLGHRGPELHVLIAKGQRDWLAEGNLDRLEAFGQSAIALSQSAGMPWFRMFEGWVATAAFWRGRWQEARDRIAENARHEAGGAFSGIMWGLLFMSEAYLDHRDTALSMLAERRDTFPTPGQSNTVGAWQALLGAVEGLTVLGERDRAAELYPLVLEARDTGTVVSYDARRLVETIAGMGAAAAGAWEQADAHYQTALEQAHEIPFQGEQPEVRRWWATMLLDRDRPGDRDRARDLLGEAVEGYRDLGMVRHLELAESRCASL